MSKKQERIGQEFFNTQGCRFKIIQYETTKKVTIKFLDEHEYVTTVTYNSCLSGQILNPFYPANCGIGYLGLDKHGNKVRTGGNNARAYSVWSGMIRRCYSGAKCYEAWSKCVVCERWHCFANFLEDLPFIDGYELWYNNPNKGISLDKDIKGDSVEYSKEKCCFVDLKQNSIERNIRNPQDKQALKAINIKTGEVVFYESTFEAEQDGFNRGAIYQCCKGKYSQHKGYKWQYVEQE